MKLLLARNTIFQQKWFATFSWPLSGSSWVLLESSSSFRTWKTYSWSFFPVISPEPSEHWPHVILLSCLELKLSLLFLSHSEPTEYTAKTNKHTQSVRFSALSALFVYTLSSHDLILGIRKVVSVDAICAYQEVKNNYIIFVQCFHCSGENKIHMHVWAMECVIFAILHAVLHCERASHICIVNGHRPIFRWQNSC